MASVGQRSASSLPSSIDSGVADVAKSMPIKHAVRPGSTDLRVRHIHRRAASATRAEPAQVTDPSLRPTASANGTSPVTAPPNRASPVPNQAVPNGKPTSPLVSTSNAMPNGGSTPAPQTVTSKDPKAVAAAASDMRNIVRRKLTGYVGFANLPNQWHRKSVRKGFNFNVMVVGKWREGSRGGAHRRVA